LEELLKHKEAMTAIKLLVRLALDKLTYGQAGRSLRSKRDLEELKINNTEFRNKEPMTAIQLLVQLAPG